MQAMEKSLGTVMVFLFTTLPSDSFIFNEAETGAMIVGCRKLVRLGVIEALMQDESSCAIIWASSNCRYPWQLADINNSKFVYSSHASCHHALRKLTLWQTDGKRKVLVLPF